MRSSLVLVGAAFVLNLAGVWSSPAGRRRDVMIWTDCANATIAHLAQHRASFTKLSPFNAGIGLRPDGRVGISTSTDAVQNLTGCAEAIHGAFRGTVEYWPCVGASAGADDKLMPLLFADPSRFIQDAIHLAQKLNITGWNLDFEATGQAPNVDHAMWLRVLEFYNTVAEALQPHGVKVSADIMCTANVTSPVLCKNGLPFFNDSATSEMVALMKTSAVERWISMATYGLDPPTTVNQIDWFVQNLGPERYGLGTAQVLSPGDDSDLLLRFSLANAYNVAEIDLFDFTVPGDCDHPCNITKITAPYFDYLARFLGAGSDTYPAGQIWPYY